MEREDALCWEDVLCWVNGNGKQIGIKLLVLKSYVL